MELITRAAYARELRADLPAGAFEPARSRLALVPIYVAVIVVAIAAIAWVPWWTVPLLSVVIAAGFAALTFVAHETLHGGIVRGRRLQRVVGWICFLPFTLSPRLWVAWHNRGHHAHTNLDADPDAYPTLARYRARRSTRFSTNMFSLGGRRWRGALSLILGFSVQSADQLISAGQRGFLTKRQHRIAIAETAAGVAVWTGVAVWIGILPFVFAYVVPVLLGNACVMAFILTNHSLNPRTAVNDPLVSSLSVTTPGLIDRLTLRFGLHVEHHLFPAMSSRHAPAVRDLVKARWPGRYQSMPLREALGRLHRTARVYKDATTLTDPRTDHDFATLQPQPRAS